MRAFCTIIVLFFALMVKSNAAPLVDSEPICKPVHYLQKKLADVCESNLRLFVITPSCQSGPPIKKAYFKKELTLFLNESITDWLSSHIGFYDDLKKVKSVQLLAVDKEQKGCEAQPRLLVEFSDKNIIFDLQSWQQPAEMFEVVDKNILISAMPHWLYNGYQGTLLIFYDTNSLATHRERKAYLKSLGFDVIAGHRWGWYLLRVPHFIGRETQALDLIRSSSDYAKLFTEVKTNACVGTEDCTVDVWSAPVFSWNFKAR